VTQIICLNRGLRVYDSTLVVPVFYGVYTAAGFLNSLIFNDEVGAYGNWTLFAIFCSIMVLVAGVILLTHKKPEHKTGAKKLVDSPPPSKFKAKLVGEDADGEESHALHTIDLESGERGGPSTSQPAWTLGDLSDDEDDARGPSSPILPRLREQSGREEDRGLMAADEDEGHEMSAIGGANAKSHARVNSAESDETLAVRAADEHDEFGEWKDGLESNAPNVP
jgi:hypothetical protein